MSVNLTRHSFIGTVAYMGGIMSLPEPFTFAWGEMRAFSEEALCGPGQHIYADRAKRSLHDFARNEIVQRMRGDWVLMLDTDIDFEPDLLARMVNAMHKSGADVVTGIYSYKREPHCPVLYAFNPASMRHEVIVQWDRSVDLFQVDSAGAGCLLVKRSVFERITKELKERPFDRKGQLGEDHSFFERLRRLDIKAWCAWKIEVSHLEYLGIRPSTNFDSSKVVAENHHVTDSLRAAARI